MESSRGKVARETRVSCDERLRRRIDGCAARDALRGFRLSRKVWNVFGTDFLGPYAPVTLSSKLKKENYRRETIIRGAHDPVRVWA